MRGRLDCGLWGREIVRDEICVGYDLLDGRTPWANGRCLSVYGIALGRDFR